MKSLLDVFSCESMYIPKLLLLISRERGKPTFNLIPKLKGINGQLEQANIFRDAIIFWGWNKHPIFGPVGLESKSQQF